ncbi:hypothetical protein [Cupriavidus sp. TMH.W2]|uniref:hypothetical protein n=1 Tax=Cupriavidus sp. TMH.W2 TaxID=3434465 RepID=UPI003D77A49B
MNTLTIADLHQEDELPSSQMTRIVGGHDVAKEKALVELYGVIHDIDKLLNTPDPAPPKVPMKL